MKQRHIIAILVAALIALTMTTLTAAPASADSWGQRSKCRPNKARATNDWHPFAFHKVRVYEVACIHRPHDGLWLNWVRQPRVSFPSTFPSNETVAVSNRPDVTKVWRDWGHVSAVRYSFNVKHCAAGTPICQNLTFLFYVNAWGGTRICAAGGRCDELKFWRWDR